ncbi:MAG: tetratricopeptide repeat protein [Deltaproteobacteria bacterium]|nr:tetratricopeptide repeat protein [Deltaproteobacteria bacterium]
MRAAKIHFQAGEQYYLRGRYEQAVSEFREAYRLSQRPALLYNIAQAYERLGDIPKAREHLKAYLDSGAAPKEEIEVLEDKIQSFDQRIGRSHERGVDESLPKTEATSGHPAEEPPPAPETEVQPPDAEAAQGLALPGSPGAPAQARPLRTWKWVALGTGGGLALGAGLLALRAKSLESSLEAEKGKGRVWEAGLKDDYDTGNASAKIARVLGGLGVAALSTGAILYALERRHAERPHALSVVPVVAPQESGIRVLLLW